MMIGPHARRKEWANDEQIINNRPDYYYILIVFQKFVMMYQGHAMNDNACFLPDKIWHWIALLKVKNI